jgi:hypothetical protein
VLAGGSISEPRKGRESKAGSLQAYRSSRIRNAVAGTSDLKDVATNRSVGKYNAGEALAVRAKANSDPTTRCAICGKPARSGDQWVANRGDWLGVAGIHMVPVHRSCSCQFAGKIGSLERARLASDQLPESRRA